MCRKPASSPLSLSIRAMLGAPATDAQCPLAQIAAHGFGSEDAQDAAYGESESQR
jgi:hypothetical protein